MTQPILAESDGPILRLTLNRPEDGNAVTNEMALELTQQLLGASSAHRMVVLRGRGDDFCTGRAAGRGGGPMEALELRRSHQVIFDCYAAFRNSTIPILCLVQGRALGFGCSIAALSDLTIATEDSRFQVPEMSRRILPTMVMSSLVDRLPRKAISHLIYTAQTIGPERALSFGIIGDIVPRERADAACSEICNAICAAPSPATEAVKEYLRFAMQMDVQGAVDFARNLHATINSSSEMKSD